MCGRFTLSRPGEVLDETIALLDGLVDPDLSVSSALRSEADSPIEPPRLEARYNIAPTQVVPVLVAHPRGVRLESLRWGIPASASGSSAMTAAKGSGHGSRSHINARAETLATKPTFRAAFQQRRCVVLADGFYEWKKSSRQPFHFSPKEQLGLRFAGLWAGLENDEPGTGVVQAPRRACCIVTTRANDVVAPIHDRMPVILAPRGLRLWLDTEITEVLTLESVLAPSPERLLRRRPVSRRVNRVILDDPSLIEEVAEAPPDPENLTLF